MKRELRRSGTDCVLCGVCGGIADYLGVESNLVRLIWAAVSMMAGTGVLLYILAAVIMPKAETSQKDISGMSHLES